MADVTDSILGIIPVAVAGGVAIGMTNMAMGMANSSQRRRGSTSQRGRGRKAIRKPVQKSTIPGFGSMHSSLF